MTETFLDGRVTLHPGDCLDALARLDEGSVDSCVCDPPYHLTSIVKRFGAANAAPAKSGATGAYKRASAGFMGKQWDGGDIAFRPDVWALVLRALKPGGHLLAFSGTRTYHRMACAIEDAGFEIRDQIGWAYGSGFPKSHDVSKGIDKASGHVRQRVAGGCGSAVSIATVGMKPGEAISGEAIEWQGWGTALKPAWEPIVLARKPLGSPAVDVRGIVERQLQERGVPEVIWTGNAKGAAKRAQPQSLSSTEAPPAAETSVGHADESGTLSDGPPILKPSERLSENGLPPTQDAQPNCDGSTTDDSVNRCSHPMAGSAPAAENASRHSSPSTTSMAAGPLTERQTTKRSMPKSAALDSQPNTDCFAGIATGLSGSLAIVRINRNPDGSFAWPENVPEFVPARPLTVAENVLQHGTGALNIDACRVEFAGTNDAAAAAAAAAVGFAASRARGTATQSNSIGKESRDGTNTYDPFALKGRWPANILHDGSDEVVGAFPETNAVGHFPKNTGGIGTDTGIYHGAAGRPQAERWTSDAGSAARFFYTAKADADDRLGSKHPTVKPLDLMQYLVRLVTPPGGTVLDPFAGTGTTGEAAWREGFNAILIEREPEYQNDIRRRMKLALGGPEERQRESIKARGLTADAGPLFGGSESTRGGGADRFTDTSQTRTDDRSNRIEVLKA